MYKHKKIIAKNKENITISNQYKHNKLQEKKRKVNTKGKVDSFIQPCSIKFCGLIELR